MDTLLASTGTRIYMAHIYILARQPYTSKIYQLVSTLIPARGRQK